MADLKKLVDAQLSALSPAYPLIVHPMFRWGYWGKFFPPHWFLFRGRRTTTKDGCGALGETFGRAAGMRVMLGLESAIAFANGGTGLKGHHPTIKVSFEQACTMICQDVSNYVINLLAS